MNCLVSFPERICIIYPNGDEVSNVDIAYICKDFTGTLRCRKNEVDELKCFDIDKIPEMIFNSAKKHYLSGSNARRIAIHETVLQPAVLGHDICETSGRVKYARKKLYNRSTNEKDLTLLPRHF